MKISKRFISISTLCLLVFGLFALAGVASSNPPVPIITRIESVSNPYIEGSTASGTEVMVYIDGVFAGIAGITATNNDISTFYYKYSSYSRLAPGKHYVYLTARDKKNIALISERTEEREITISSVLAPTITKPTNNSITIYKTPWIEGWGPNDSYVHVYIDNVYVGKTSYLFDPTGNSVKFVFKPTTNYSLGWHKAFTVAEDKNGLKSLVSNLVTFKIEEKLPAPTLLSVKAGKNNTLPVISGLAANDSRVKIYNNDQEVVQVSVKNGDKGTGSFSYTFLKPLSGKNTFKTIASDRRGKLSQVSNTIVYDASKAKTAAKTVTAVDTDGDGLSDYLETNRYKTDPKNADTDGDGYKDGTEVKNGYSPLVVSWKDTKKTAATPAKVSVQKPAVKQEVKAEKIKADIPADTNTKDEQTVDEAVELDLEQKIDNNGTTSSIGEFFNRNRSRLNLIIFVVFLIGVVAWIFWVNREIIKERTKQKNKKTGPKDPEIDMDDEPKLPL